MSKLIQSSIVLIIIILNLNISIGLGLSLDNENAKSTNLNIGSVDQESNYTTSLMTFYPFEEKNRVQKIYFKFELDKFQKAIFSDFIQIKLPMSFNNIVEELIIQNIMKSTLKINIINEKYHSNINERQINTEVINYLKENDNLLINFKIIDNYNSVEINSIHNIVEAYLEIPFPVDVKIKIKFQVFMIFMSSNNDDGIIYFSKQFEIKNSYNSNTLNSINQLSILDSSFFNFEKVKNTESKIFVNVYHDLKIHFNVNTKINKGNIIVLKVINSQSTSYSLSNIVYSKDFFNNNSGLIDEMGNFKLSVSIPKEIINNEFDSGYTLTNYVLIDIANEIIPGNYSFIVKKCFTGKSTGIFTFELQLINEQTFSIISQSKLMKNFNIVEGEIIVNSIKHPENLDIYQGSIWPIIFDFTINASGENSYIVVSQTNTSINSNKLNFMASTCDFTISDSDINNIKFSHKFNERPVCYPTKRSLIFEEMQNFKGSGIAFKIPEYYYGQKLVFQIFIYAEICGTTHTACNIINNSCTSLAKFEFQAELFDNLDKIEIDTLKFQNLLAKSERKYFENYCFNNILYNTLKSSTITTEQSYQPFSYIYKDAYLLEPNSIYFREFTDFELGIIKEDMITPSNGLNRDFLYNVSTINVENPPLNSVLDNTMGFLNNPSTLNSSFLSVKMPINYPSNKYVDNINNPENHNIYGPMGVFALPIFFRDNINYFYFKSKMFFNISSKFIKEENLNKCYLSWANNAHRLIDTINDSYVENQAISNTYNKSTEFPNTGSKNLVYYLSDNSGILRYLGNENGRIQYETTVQNSDPGSNPINSTLNPTNYIFLKHIMMKASGQNVPFTDHHGYFGLFNSCIKFKENFPIVKSQYTYFEFSLNFSRDIDNLDNFQIIRVNRFFKFIFELGITDNNRFYEKSANLITYHYVNFPNYNESTLPYFQETAICVLQISKDLILDNPLKEKQNTLVIFFYKIGMIQTDIEKIGSTYPIYTGNYNMNNIFSSNIKSSDRYNKIFNYNEVKSEAYLLPSNLTTIGRIHSRIIKQNYGLERYFMNTDIPNLRKYPKTTPHQFVENQLIITNLMNSIIKEDILIPTLCPIQCNYNVKETQQLSPIMNPNISFYFSSEKDYRSIANVSRFVVSNNKNSIWTLPDKLLKKSMYINKSPTPNQETPVYTSIKYQSNTIRENSLYISPWSGNQYNNGSPSNPPKYKFNCSSFILMMDEKLKYTNNQNLRIGSHKLIGKISSQYDSITNYTHSFFLLGKKFNNIVFYTSNILHEMPYQAIRSKELVVKGLLQHKLEDLKENNYLKVVDRLSFMCVSKGDLIQDPNNPLDTLIYDNNYFSNYNTKLINPKNLKESYFLLDLQKEETIWKDFNISLDNQNENIQKNDFAGNISINVKMPNDFANNLINGTVINIETEKFRKYSKCAVDINYSSYINECNQINNKNLIQCKIPQIMNSNLHNINNSIKICCYGILTDVDSFTLKNFSIGFEYGNIIGSKTHIWNSIYNPSNLKNLSWNTENTSGSDFKNSNIQIDSSIITEDDVNEVIYKNSQISSIEINSKNSMLISITLNRLLVRGSSLQLSFDFTKTVDVNFMKEVSKNVYFRCLNLESYMSRRISSEIFSNQQFNNLDENFGSGYSLIEKCSLHIVDGILKILVKFKDSILKCGKKLNKKIYFAINPFMNLTTDVLKEISADISWVLPQEKYENNLSKAESSKFTEINQFLNQEQNIRYSKIEFKGQKMTKIKIISDRFLDNVVLQGRFSRFFLNYQGEDNLEYHLNLIDESFEISPSKVYFNTFNNNKLFYIGTGCATKVGIYYLIIQQRDSNNYTNINEDASVNYPLKVMVSSFKEKIKFSSQYVDIVFGGTVDFFAFVSNPIFEKISINFSSDSSNNSLVSLDNITIEKGESSGMTKFNANSLIVTGAQKFSLNTPPACFEFQYSLIIFNINVEPKIFPDFYNPESNFKYLNFEKEVEDKLLNTINISFYPDIVPVNIFCSLINFDSDFPDDKDIVKLPNNKNISTIKNYIGSSNYPHLISFKNIDRTKDFKLKCLIENPVIDSIKKRISIQFTKLKEESNTKSLINVEKKVDIKANKLQDTICVQFTFKFGMDWDSKKRIVEYCQLKLNELNECYKCEDYYNNNYEKIAQNKFSYSSNIKEFSFLFKDSISVFSESDKYFTVCVPQKKDCYYNNKNDNNYKEKFFEFINSSNTNIKLFNNLSIFNSIENTIFFTDYKPFLSRNIFDFSKTEIISPDGYVLVSLKLSDQDARRYNSLKCYFRITTAVETNLSENLIFNCENKSRCGTSKLSKNISYFELNKKVAVKFEYNKYNLWSTCSLDIPNPIYFTKPQILLDFTITPNST